MKRPDFFGMDYIENVIGINPCELTRLMVNFDSGLLLHPINGMNKILNSISLRLNFIKKKYKICFK
ncbi:MAG: hypothetical protein RL065_129 [Bacteroidota bacterium]